METKEEVEDGGREGQPRDVAVAETENEEE